ncbi:alpha/beta hydrolase [Streptomyces monomycini]|uniref:alpha/beta hydrolase n=1 Tax=Streptomyces monomycini TaxID=371720 RepID=UPI00067DCF81|nr:alpha/beta hydrolase [Streptomyces monomycini]
MTIQESVLRYGDSPWQRVDLYVPAEGPARSAAVIFHGGFWRHDRIARDLEPLAVALVRRGCATAVVEYRPAWDGGLWPAAAEDARTALGRLDAGGAPWQDATIVGHSAGAHLALSAVAGQGAGRRVVLLAPVVELAYAAAAEVGGKAVGHFLAGHLAAGGTAEEATPRPSQADLASLTVFEAACDQAVPAELTEHQLSGWRERGLVTDHHVVPDARHMHLVNPERDGCAPVLTLLAGAPVSAEGSVS